MKKIKEFSQIFIVLIFLTSCRSSINKDFPIIKTEGDNIEKNNQEKKRMELKFSIHHLCILKYRPLCKKTLFPFFSFLN